MALNAAVQFEIRQGGSDTNGGGFKSGASGTDWTLQDSAQYSVTDGVTAGTTTITSATANFGTDVVGNLVYVQGGTGSVAANWYEITARTNSTTITVDRSTGLTAGTGVTLKIGGAFATLGVLNSASGGVGGVMVGGNKVWVKYSATAMDCSTSTAGPAGPLTTVASVALSIEGYETTRGDRTGSRPSYKWTASSPGAQTYLVTLAGGARQVFSNILLDGNATTNVSGISLGAGSHPSAIDCVVQGCSTASQIGFRGAGGSFVRCFSTGNTTGFSATSGICVGCTATGGTTGFSWPFAVKCLAYSTGTGFSHATNGGLWHRCTADSCTTNGFASTASATYSSCLATNCTGSANGYSVGTNIATLLSCAYYNNNTHVTGTPLTNLGAISLSGDPYVNQGSQDFRPDDTSGEGAFLRAAGVGVYGQTDNDDVGAGQHTDPSGGGSTVIIGGEF